MRFRRPVSKAESGMGDECSADGGERHFADGAATSRSPRAAGSPASVTDAKKGAFERDLLAIVPGGARNPNVSGDMTTVSPWQDCCVS